MGDTRPKGGAVRFPSSTTVKKSSDSTKVEKTIDEKIVPATSEESSKDSVSTNVESKK